MPQVQKAFQGKDLNREQKTELVNAAVQRSQAGSYQFDMTSQVLRSLCTFTEKTTGEQTAKGLPRSLMVSKLGSEANLEKAMQAGEVTECTQGGRVYYVWNTVKITRAREAASQVKAESTVEASDAAVQSMALFVDNYTPTLGNSFEKTSFDFVFYHHLLLFFFFFPVIGICTSMTSSTNR